jgi:acetylornithine deacetylase
MEDKASDIVIEALMPYTQPNGPLSVERVTYVEGRGNLIIKYPGASPGKVCSFVGSHMDVVPASAEGWSRDPFKLIIEGDMLYGRGTTDCLGHVALITDLFISLALKKPVLQTEIVAIFIANEENSVFLGVGIDQLAKEGNIRFVNHRGEVFLSQ